MLSEKIKVARQTRGLSYSQLAHALQTTVENVAGWENGSVVPSPEMCEKLSVFFGGPIEDLDIENLKKEMQLKESVRANKKTFSLFAILGSLFVGIGVTILLVSLWDVFPGAIKTFVSFLPLILSQCAVLFTYKKKYPNVAWREGASVLWSLGVTATVGLVSMVLGLHFGVGACLLIDAILILPVMLFFDAISPMYFYYTYALIGSFSMASAAGWPEVAGVLILALFMVGGFVYYHTSKTRFLPRRAAVIKITTQIFAGLFCLCTCLSANWGVSSVLLALSVLACVLVSESKKTLGAFACVAVALFSVITVQVVANGSAEPEKLEIFTVLLLIIGILVYAVWRGAAKGSLDLTKTLFCGLGSLIALLPLLGLPSDMLWKALSVLVFILAFVQGVVAVVGGVGKNKHLFLNIGLIEIFVLILFVLSSYDWSMTVVGLMFLLCGGILLGTNMFVSKRIQKEQAELVSGGDKDENI